MLHQKIEDNVNGVCDIVSEIKDMTSQIKMFMEDLVKACNNPNANEHRVLEVIVKKFKILVHEASDAVTNYFAHEKKHGNNALAKSLNKIAHRGKPNSYASEIQSIKEKVKRISEDHTKDLLHLLEDYNKLRDMRLPKVRAELRENKMVGFNDDLKTIKTLLMEASTKDFFVIPIVGSAGTGKTTFALKIFEDPEIEELGIKIAEKCNGLPHALVLVAGILRNCINSAGWQRVADNLLLVNNEEDQSYHELVKMTYNDLPDEKLKNCFLYFACFPIGHEIVVWKLIRLWIAEELIPTIDEQGYALEAEVEAEKYLNDLVDRNLVMVKKRRVNGQIKTCSIHNTLHEFCKSEGARINLFHVMDEGQRLNARIDLWRLCSYYTMNIFDHVENNNPSDSFSNLFNKRMGPRQDAEFVGSLLMSSSQKREIHSTPEQLETILKTFKYLHVLNIESLKFSSLPNELYSEGSIIKYLAITADINSLPKSFEHLSRLETLVIKTTERALQINGGIWNMKKLRHVHTNTSKQLPSPPKRGKHSHKQTDIRTLSTISPGSCTSKIFNKTPKLQKLGVRGNLSKLLEEKQNVCLFNNLQMLECLENLKLYGNSEKLELKVPMSNKFPRRLTKLTLSGTLFQWDDMIVLGLLEKLKVLKLDDNAFSGEHWNLSSDVIFKTLQYLRIGKMNLITWTAVDSGKSFPVLESLVLRNCISLENIPQDLANVECLKVMELFDVNKRVFDFAREICVKRHGKTNVKINGFITHLPPQATVSL
nr:putative late blight resistance protein homolog R1B-14 [Ipomoea batatas]